MRAHVHGRCQRGRLLSACCTRSLHQSWQPPRCVPLRLLPANLSAPLFHSADPAVRPGPKVRRSLGLDSERGVCALAFWCEGSGVVVASFVI